MAESTHRMLWRRRDYNTRHEKFIRKLLSVDTDWEPHSELHGLMQPPKKPDIGITLSLIDHLNDKTDDLPLHAIDRLVKLRSDEALDLADHFTRQLGILGLYGVSKS